MATARPKVQVERTVERDGTVRDDASPQLTDIPWAQFIINARGAFFDQYAAREDMTYAERLQRNFDCDWAARVQDGVWTAEIRVPLDELGVDPARDRMLPINFVRNVQEKPGEISSWFVSIKAHADALSRGWIVLQSACRRG